MQLAVARDLETRGGNIFKVNLYMYRRRVVSRRLQYNPNSQVNAYFHTFEKLHIWLDSLF